MSLRQDQTNHPSLRTSITKSSLTGVAQFVVNTVLVFFTIPIFVGRLGAEEYGVFSLVAIVGNVNTFANLGLSPSLVRFLASQGKSRESDHDIVMTFVMLLVIVSPLALVGLLFENQILTHVFNVPVRLLREGQWLFVSTLCGSILVLLGQTFTAILESQQKIYLTNSFQMIYNFIYWILILLSVSLGFGLEGVAVGTFVATVVWFCIVLFSALKSWGGISVGGLKENYRRIVRKQLSYGLQVYAAGVVGFFHEPITKILISRFVGVPEAGLFDIALRVRNQLVGLIMKLLSPLYPAISQISEHHRVRWLVHDVEQKTFLAAMPLVAVIVVAAKPVASLVFHSNIEAIAVAAAWIVTVYLLFSTTVNPIYLFLIAKGYPARTILIQCLNVIVNAGVFFILLPWLGYYAAVAGNVAAIVTSFVVLLLFQKKFLDSVIFDSARQILKMVLAFAVAVGLGYFAGTLYAANVWKVISAPLVVLAVSSVLYRQLGLIKGEDVRRYLGQGNVVERFASWLLVGGHR